MSEGKYEKEPPEAGLSRTGASGSPPPDLSTKSTVSEQSEEPSESKSEENDAEVDLEEDENQETYTFDDVVNKAGYGKFQKLLTFFAGLSWLADAFEVIILSIIGDLLACEWEMQRWMNALMTSMVFCGMAIGAPIFGILADRFGRKTAIGVSMLFLFSFGAASAASPSYTWMIVLRALMGMALGGVAQSVTLACEYYPAQLRGKAGFYLSYYWSLGTIGVVIAAWIVMQYMDNWRIFVFVASVPALIVFVTLKWFPESVRYLLISGQRERAEKTVLKLVRMNQSELPKGKLVHVDACNERGKIFDLLKPAMRRSTLLFWYIWLAVACAYYAIALFTPYIVTHGSLLEAAESHENKTFAEDFTARMACIKFSHANFRDLLWTSAAEFPGILTFSLTIEYCNRKTYLGTSCLFLAFMLLFLMLKMEPQIAIFMVLFICRGLVAAIFQLLFIMTTESFPTTLRASAMGTGSGCARIGGFIIPFLAQVAVIAKPIPSIFVLSGITALAGVAAYLLPVETRGKYMQDVVYQVPTSAEKEKDKS